MTDMTPADFRYRLASVASVFAMPSKAKLDALGIDVDTSTLPSMAEINAQFDPFSAPAVKSLVAQIAFEAMWRTAQQLGQATMEAEGWQIDD